MELGCQTCLRVIEDPSEGLFINNISSSSDEIPLKEKLLDCVPELVLDSIKQVILCNLCVENLMAAYEFKQRCIHTQEKIYGFLQQDNLQINVGIIAVHYRRLELLAQGANPIIPDPPDEIYFPRTPYNCRWCNFSCLDKSVITHHEILHVNTAPPYKCAKCPFIFPSSPLLLDHLATHFKEEPYSCTICDFTTSSRKKLTQHCWTHRKPFQCNICWIRFNEKKQLKVHMKIHEDEEKSRPFHCGLCEFKTEHLKYLKCHFRYDHLNGYKCKKCMLECRTEEGLKHHIMKIHEIAEKVKEDPPTVVPDLKPSKVSILPPSDVVLIQQQPRIQPIMKVPTAVPNLMPPQVSILPPSDAVLIQQGPRIQPIMKVPTAVPNLKPPQVSILPPSDVVVIQQEPRIRPLMEVAPITMPQAPFIADTTPSRMVLEQLYRWRAEGFKLTNKPTATNKPTEKKEPIAAPSLANNDKTNIRKPKAEDSKLSHNPTATNKPTEKKEPIAAPSFVNNDKTNIEKPKAEDYKLTQNPTDTNTPTEEKVPIAAPSLANNDKTNIQKPKAEDYKLTQKPTEEKEPIAGTSLANKKKKRKYHRKHNRPKRTRLFTTEGKYIRVRRDIAITIGLLTHQNESKNVCTTTTPEADLKPPQDILEMPGIQTCNEEPITISEAPVIVDTPTSMVLEQLHRWETEAHELTCKPSDKCEPGKEGPIPTRTRKGRVNLSYESLKELLSKLRETKP